MVGEEEGLEVGNGEGMGEGGLVGLLEGLPDLVGDALGAPLLVGPSVGALVGLVVAGLAVIGLLVGALVGLLVGALVGLVVGALVGLVVGVLDGLILAPAGTKSWQKSHAKGQAFLTFKPLKKTPLVQYLACLLSTCCFLEIQLQFFSLPFDMTVIIKSGSSSQQIPQVVGQFSRTSSTKQVA